MDVPSRYSDLTMQRKRERWLRELQNASLHKTKYPQNPVPPTQLNQDISRTNT